MNKKIIPSTPFGSIGILWATINGSPRIIRILLSKPGFPSERHVFRLFPQAQASSCSEIEDAGAGIMRILAGEEVEFSLDLVNMGACSPFQQRVLGAVHQVPRGRVSSYGAVARSVGRRNGARAVGTVMEGNPFPLIVPCHRILRSDGSLGGYGAGPGMKRALLEMEGVRFDDTGRAMSLI